MKNFNKKYLIFIGLGVVFLITAFIFKDSIKGEQENIPKQNINTSLNLDKGRATTTSQLDAYYQEETDSLKNARKGSGMDLSNFGKSSSNNENINTGIIKKGKTDNEIIDSILNAQKIIYKKPVVKNRRSNNNYRRDRKREKIKLEKERKKIRKREKEEERARIIAGINESFANSNYDEPEVKNNKSNNLRTDKDIAIMVNGDQTIKKGDRVNLLLKEDAVINGISYQRNTRLYGFASFGNHRLYIRINNIKNNPVKLNIYDAQDGDLGLYTKQNLAGELGQEVSDDAIDEVEVQGVNVGKIKSIFKKKNKEPKLLLFNRTKFVLN